MKILVACEESQAVTKEFRKCGHEAYSCDLEPCSGGHPEWHYQGDVLPHIHNGWDLVIAFPPCTYLCSSGMHWTTRGLRDPQLTEDAAEFFLAFTKLECAWAIENPIGCMSTRFRKPDQIIQPWQFGDDASKKTCLWLNKLPMLEHTDIVAPMGWGLVKYAYECHECPDCDEPFCAKCDEHYHSCDCIGPHEDAAFKKIDGVEFGCRSEMPPKPVWANQTPSGQNKLGPSADRAKLRSKTYPGIAKAMAKQWG